MDSPEGARPRRFVVGIGVGEYDDPTLTLPVVGHDVQAVTEWFSTRTRLSHELALPDLAKSPRTSDINASLRSWLLERQREDVVILYVAAHGETEGKRTYLLGRESPRTQLAGAAISGEDLGTMIGQAPAHNVLLIVDVCVAGLLGASIQRAAEDIALENNTRDPHLLWCSAVLCSTFGRDPAHEGRFVQAFLKVVSEERWTGTSRPFVDLDQLMTGLNQELKDLKVPQVAERKVWGSGAAELIPNPNFGARKLGSPMGDEDLAAHFDPSARGVARGEPGSYFTGRTAELSRVVNWLRTSGDDSVPFVMTGSPGSGKSALLSRLVVLSDPELRKQVRDLNELPPATVPPESSIHAVIWARNKTADQVAGEIAQRLGATARTPADLVAELAERTAERVGPSTIAVDALDEAIEGEATPIAELLKSLSSLPNVRTLVATRPHPVRGRIEQGAAPRDLLSDLGVRREGPNCLVLDLAEQHTRDMQAYVTTRLLGTSDAGASPYRGNPVLAARVADRIVEAAGASFLVASIAARTLVMQREPVDPDTESLELPSKAGAALADYIRRLSDPEVVVDVLRPLAWAQGQGLPWGPIWAPLATALANAAHPAHATSYDDDTIAAVLDRAGDLVVESIAFGEPGYRLFHEALAEHMRSDLDAPTANAALARVLNEQLLGAPFEQAHPYVLSCLTDHLALAPGQHTRLYELATDPDWERAKRLRFGDSSTFLRDLDLAIRGLLAQQPVDLASLVGACLVHSRKMATAPAVVIAVIGRLGQLHRAEMMANNLTFAVDRCHAFCALAKTFDEEGDDAAARRCLAEAERAIAAIDTTHANMAWSWLADAAATSRLKEVCSRAATSAAGVVDRLTEHGSWEFPNVVFWAGRAARTAQDEALRRRLSSTFAARVETPARNQELQAAAVLDARESLQEATRRWRTQTHGSIVRVGNLALALADAGMSEELGLVLADVEKDETAHRAEDDAEKRMVWALAIAGKFDSAFRRLKDIRDQEQKVRALGRLVDVASQRGNREVLIEAKDMASSLDQDASVRVRTLFVPLWHALGEKERALDLAETLVREGISPSASNSVLLPFEKPDSAFVRARHRKEKVAIHRMVKVGKRLLPIQIGTLSDQETLHEVSRLAEAGQLAEAISRLAGIRVPQFRWMALSQIAAVAPPESQSRYWRDALLEARMYSEPAVRVSTGFLAISGIQEPDAILQELDRVSMRWIEATFVEQYESLRTSLPHGSERTHRLEDLMLTPLKSRHVGSPDASGPDVVSYQFAIDTLRPWTASDVRNLVASGRPGKRVFALVLMKNRRELAQFDPVLELIDRSQSAFEQYHALTVALEMVDDLTLEERTRLSRVLEEQRGKFILPGTDRHAVAGLIERKIEQRRP